MKIKNIATLVVREDGLVMNTYQNRHVAKGFVAGTLDRHGYYYIRLLGKNIKVHRLVAHLFCGLDIASKDSVDHIDGNRANNNYNNLRVATTRDNQLNRVCHREGHLPGTSLITKTGRWRSKIRVDGKDIQIGCFGTQLEAHNAYMEYRIQHSL